VQGCQNTKEKTANCEAFRSVSVLICGGSGLVVDRCSWCASKERLLDVAREKKEQQQELSWKVELSALC
jgi:hypothetical protein